MPRAEGRRALPQIDQHIEDCTARATNRLDLAIRIGLPVQAAQSAAARIERGAALNKICLKAVGAKNIRVEGARKPSAFVGMTFRPDAEGTWHVVAGGECSWHEFAMAIVGDALVAGLIQKAPKLIGISSRDYPSKAQRPSYSRLDTSKFANDFDFRLPDWRVGVREVIGELAEARAAS